MHIVGWSPITDNAALDANANDTGPHADSRNMVIDAKGNILEGDDGGIYRYTVKTHTWTSMNGNITPTEVYSAGYDPLNHLIFAERRTSARSVRRSKTVPPGKKSNKATAATSPSIRS